MDSPQSPLHPEVPALLASLNLALVEVIKWNVYTCAPASEPGVAAFVLKIGSDPRKAESLAYEVKIIRELLPTFDQRLFERLVLPEYVNDGMYGELRWLLTKHIPGRPLMHEWSELNIKPETLGGKTVDVAVASAAVDVLRDLRQADITAAPELFRTRAAELVTRGQLEQSVADGAETLFSARSVARYEGSMFTNGDFYPRNFIILPEGRIALVDWVGGVDPWEFVAMYAWLMMWGNAAWQVEYVTRIKEHFPVDIDEMQVALLSRSFDLAYQWRELPEEQVGLARAQMLAYFRQCLNKDYVKGIFA
jgi:hypothetical protein